MAALRAERARAVGGRTSQSSPCTMAAARLDAASSIHWLTGSPSSPALCSGLSCSPAIGPDLRAAGGAGRRSGQAQGLEAGCAARSMRAGRALRVAGAQQRPRGARVASGPSARPKRQWKRRSARWGQTLGAAFFWAGFAGVG